MKNPKLTFFCELDKEPLCKLFENRFVMDDLKTLDASLSLGILDLSDERAQVVKKINKLGIPMIAWLLLPKEQGYWFNIDNYPEAIARYEAFKEWTKRHKLSWVGIGLDIEPDINAVQQVRDKQIKLLPELIRRLKNKKRLRDALAGYRQLVNQIRTDGWRVESYHFPLIIDERKARSTLLQRLIGLVDLDADTEVLMLYSSFLRPRGHELLWQYASETDSIGIGNTGGGVDLKGVIDVPPLTWEEFSRDLRLVYRMQKPAHIFCLEGCVAQGFLEKLITFDWEKETEIPQSHLIHHSRKALQALLWTFQRPWIILGSIIGIVSGIFLFKRKK